MPAYNGTGFSTGQLRTNTSAYRAIPGPLMTAPPYSLGNPSYQNGQTPNNTTNPPGGTNGTINDNTGTGTTYNNTGRANTARTSTARATPQRGTKRPSATTRPSSTAARRTAQPTELPGTRQPVQIPRPRRRKAQFSTVGGRMGGFVVLRMPLNVDVKTSMAKRHKNWVESRAAQEKIYDKVADPPRRDTKASRKGKKTEFEQEVIEVTEKAKSLRPILSLLPLFPPVKNSSVFLGGFTPAGLHSNGTERGALFEEKVAS